MLNPSYAAPNASAIEDSFISRERKGPAADEEEMDVAAILDEKIRKIEESAGLQRGSLDEPMSESIADIRADDDFAAEVADAPIPQSSGGMMRDRSLMSAAGVARTDDAIKHERMQSAMAALAIQGDDILIADREQDVKISMIEEIRDLRQTAIDDGDDVEQIAIPTVDESIDTIRTMLMILRRHNDRKRFSALADDCIMVGAKCLESICDGEHAIFGFRPDLRGWSNHVRAKLRRMRHDTSQIANSVIGDGIGPGMRLLIELLPSMIMYAHDRKPSASRAEGVPDERLTHAIANLRGT